MFDWILANLDRLAIRVIAAAIVLAMLAMRWIGHRLLADEPETWGWRGIIGRVLAKTSIFFMIAAAVDIVVSYAAIPTKLAHLADIFFIIAAALQVAIWAREIIVGVIRSRVGDDPGASTLGNAMASSGAGERRRVRHRAGRHPRQSRGQRHRAGRRARYRRYRHRPAAQGILPTCSPPCRSYSTGRSAAATPSATALAPTSPSARSSGSASRPRASGPDRRAGDHGQHQAAGAGSAQPRRGQGPAGRRAFSLTYQTSWKRSSGCRHRGTGA